MEIKSNVKINSNGKVIQSVQYSAGNPFTPEIDKGGYKIKSTTWKGFFITFLAYLVILLVGFIVFFSYTAIAGTSFNIPFLVTFVVILCLVFLILPIEIGVRIMKLWAEPPQPFKRKYETIKEILAYNSDEYPVEFQSNDKYDIVIKTKVSDAKWKGILFKGGVNVDYTLFLKLDEAKKTAYCAEKMKKINWNVSIFHFDFDFSLFYGIIFFNLEKMKVYDALQAFKKVGTVDYNLTDVKWPIFSILIKDGWTISPRLFPFQVRK